MPTRGCWYLGICQLRSQQPAHTGQDTVLALPGAGHACKACGSACWPCMHACMLAMHACVHALCMHATHAVVLGAALACALPSLQTQCSRCPKHACKVSFCQHVSTLLFGGWGRGGAKDCVPGACSVVPGAPNAQLSLLCPIAPSCVGVASGAASLAPVHVAQATRRPAAGRLLGAKALNENSRLMRARPWPHGAARSVCA